MSQQRPSISAVGAHLDVEVEIAALARHYYEEEGSPEGRSLEHWLRAECEIRERNIQPVPEIREEAPSESDIKTEEMMHIDQ